MSDYRATTGEAKPLSRRDRGRQRRKWVRRGLLVLVGLLAVGTCTRVSRYVPASGQVTPELYAEVRPPGQGVVARILVESGAQVEAGDVLVQLDDSAERASASEAAGVLRKVEAELAKRRAEIAEEKRQRASRIAMSRLRVEHATAKLRLTGELYEKGLAAGSALEDARFSEKLARTELETLLNADEHLPEKDLAVIEKQLEASRGAEDRTRARLHARRILTPIPGKAVRYGFVVGELVRPDTVLYEILGGDRQVLELRVPERYATLVAPGQSCRAQLLPYRGLRRVWFEGSVEKLRDVIQTGNQKTYRVVYCSFDARGLPVPPGTTAEAKIAVGRSPIWKSLLGLY